MQSGLIESQMSIFFQSVAQTQGQSEEAGVCCDGHGSQSHHDIPTCAESLAIDPIVSDFREKLRISLPSSKQAD